MNRKLAIHEQSVLRRRETTPYISHLGLFGSQRKGIMDCDEELCTYLENNYVSNLYYLFLMNAILKKL